MTSFATGINLLPVIAGFARNQSTNELNLDTTMKINFSQEELDHMKTFRILDIDGEQYLRKDLSQEIAIKWFNKTSLVKLIWLKLFSK